LFVSLCLHFFPATDTCKTSRGAYFPGHHPRLYIKIIYTKHSRISDFPCGIRSADFSGRTDAAASLIIGPAMINFSGLKAVIHAALRHGKFLVLRPVRIDFINIFFSSKNFSNKGFVLFSFASNWLVVGWRIFAI